MTEHSAATGAGELEDNGISDRVTVTRAYWTALHFELAAFRDALRAKDAEIELAHKAADDVYKRLMPEIERLTKALRDLNQAVDDFWNAPERPSIANMRCNTVRRIHDAQVAALAALKEQDHD